jgi:hypothetical protein
LPGPFGERGKITRICSGNNEEPASLKEVKFYFDQNSQSDPWPYSTQASGHYNHYGRLSNDHNKALLKPKKGGVPLNGIDVDDIVTIRDHILGVHSLPPHDMIAADVNFSSSVTSNDMLNIRQLILGIIPEFTPSVGVWRYIPKMPFVTQPTFVTNFHDNNPFDAVWNDPQGINRSYKAGVPIGNGVTTSYMDEFDVDFHTLGYDLASEDTWSFYIVKAGDVNCTAVFDELNGGGGEGITEDEPSLMSSTHNTFQSGDYINVNVTGMTGGNIDGYQFCLDFDHTKVELLGIEPGELPFFSFDNFNLLKLSEGKLRAIWYNPIQSASYSLIQSKNLFKVKLRAKTTISNIEDIITFGDELRNVFVNNSQYASNSQVVLQASLGSSTQNKLTNVLPSPMTSTVSFILSLYQPSSISVILTDQFGQTVNSQQNMPSGTQTLTINNLQNLANGIVFYSLIAGSQTFAGTLMKSSE